MSDSKDRAEAIEKKLELLEQAKKFVDDYHKEQEGYKNLWEIFKQNALTDDFKNSRYAGLTVVGLPIAFNFVFYFKPNIAFKNTIRLAVITGSLINFQYNLDKDLKNLAKQDSPVGNLVRSNMQSIAKNNEFVPFFGKETIEIYNKRKGKEANNQAITEETSSNRINQSK